MYLEFWQIIVLFSKCESGCLTIKHKLNREEKSLHHIAMVAKFLDDNKPIKSIRTISNFTDVIELANLSEIIFFGTVSIDI